MKEYLPIEQFGVFLAFPELFSKRFSNVLHTTRKNKKLNVGWLTTTDVWRQISEIRKQHAVDKEEFSMPYCFLKLGAINTLNSADGNLNFLGKNLYRMGMPGKPNESGVYNVHRFISAEFNIEVTFITDSYDEVKRYVNKWNFVAVGQRLNQDWLYDGITLAVRTDMETGVSIPEEAAGVEEINYYEIKTNLIIRGFMSEGNLDFQRETACEIKRIVVRPVMYDPQFANLSIQVSSDIAGNTNPNYIPRDTTPPSVEQLVVEITDDGDVIIEENF